MAMNEALQEREDLREEISILKDEIIDLTQRYEYDLDGLREELSDASVELQRVHAELQGALTQIEEATERSEG